MSTNKPPSPGTIAQLELAVEAFTLKSDLVMADAHPRPNYGTLGKPINVEANMYQVRYKDITVLHYDVSFSHVVKVSNPKFPKELSRKIWNQVCREHMSGNMKTPLNASAFDGLKNVYTTTKFPANGAGKTEFTVTLQESGNADAERFKVVLQLANEIDLGALMRFCKKDKQSTQEAELVATAIQAWNVLLREDPLSRFTPKGARGRFFGTEAQVPISGGGVVGKGFMQSLRPTECGFPAIQLDAAFTAFFEAGPLIEVIPKILGMAGAGGGGGRGGFGGGDRGGRGGRGGFRGRGGPPGGGGGAGAVNLSEIHPKDINKLNKLLYGAKFSLPYKKLDRSFTFKKLTREPASGITFLLNGKDGAASRKVGIVPYFKEQYNITITKPRLPCVVYGKNFMVPVELVVLNSFNSIPFSQLSGDQAADMIRVAAQKPLERSAFIKNWRQKLNYQNLPKLKAWGLEVKPEMMQLQARVLNPPRVTYKGNKQLDCRFGGWNLKGVQFTRPNQVLKSWAVVILDGRLNIERAQGFVTTLINTLKSYGCAVQNTRPPCIKSNPQQEKLLSILGQACRDAYIQAKENPQMLLIIMPKKDVHMYAEIKRVAATQLKAPVVTQCLQAQKVTSDRGLDQYCANVAMKIHSKLGGVTHEVPSALLDKTTLMIGADVTHPPFARGSLIQPSIAVTVAGVNGDNVMFQAGIRLQEGRVEIIKDLAGMVYNHMKQWQSNMKDKSLPQRILFFRDGVSEGQYMQVCDLEVEAIRAAARRIDANYKPKITFVICAKKHNMRFFAANEADVDRTGNLPPGTVVDRGVTHPFAFDFYLQAHAGLQGTARPTHYVVLRDENGFNADKMQTLCNNLCSSYARATRAVSLIPVAYYADIAAGHARNFIYTDEDDSTAPSTVSGDSGKLQTRTFNPLQLAQRLEQSDFNKVLWYM